MTVAIDFTLFLGGSPDLPVVCTFKNDRRCIHPSNGQHKYVVNKEILLQKSNQELLTDSLVELDKRLLEHGNLFDIYTTSALYTARLRSKKGLCMSR